MSPATAFVYNFQLEIVYSLASSVDFNLGLD